MSPISPDLNERLLEILMRIPALQDQANRNLLLRNLAGPVGTISRSSAPLADVGNIINAVASWERLGSGELAIVIVLRNASVFVKGLGLEKELEKISDQIKAEAQPSHSGDVPSDQKKLYILHLSDIHLGTPSEAHTYRSQLETDLMQQFGVTHLSYLVISGDIADYSTMAEFKAALELIREVTTDFELDPRHIVIVPGNHDLDWARSRKAYAPIAPGHKLPNPLTDEYGQDDTLGVLRRNEGPYRKRFENFRWFYDQVRGEQYPLNYVEQGILYPYPDDRILFLGLNSSWQVDHLHPKRSGIHMEALANTLNPVIKGKYSKWLQVAVWHHPITGQEMMNDEFAELLSVNKFQVCMHGHVHEAKSDYFRYDYGRGLHIVGAGTFGAKAKDQVLGVPLQYNLLILDPKEKVIVVETRKKEKPNGAWSADSRWVDKGKNPEPRYTIKLEEWTFS